MTESNELLALGIALTRTVREEIKYSTNIKSFFPDKRTALYRDLDEKLNGLRAQGYINFSDRAQAALAAGCGNCGELACCVMFLASILPKIFVESVYISLVYFDADHSLIMLHQFERLGSEAVRFNKIVEIKKIEELSNAVIVDPWIYKAAKLSNFEELYYQAVDYQVKESYHGSFEINFQENYSETSELYDNYYQGYSQLVERCLEIYYERLDKQKIRRDSYNGERRRLSEADYHKSIRYSLERETEVRIDQLDDLIRFFEGLHESTSSWYGASVRSNRKGKCINRVITALREARGNEYLPDEWGMKKIFYAVLRIAPLVRGEKYHGGNVKITKTAEALFDYTVVPRRRYSFENIAGISLDFIRVIRSESRRERYRRLLEYLYETNRVRDPKFQRIEEFENCCFYESLYNKHFKVYYYAEIDTCIGYILNENML